MEQGLGPSVRDCCKPSTTAPRPCGSETESHLSQMADRLGPAISETQCGHCANEHAHAETRTVAIAYLHFSTAVCTSSTHAHTPV